MKNQFKNYEKRIRKLFVFYFQASQCVYLICLPALELCRSKLHCWPHFVNNCSCSRWAFFSLTLPLPLPRLVNPARLSLSLAWMAKCISCSSAFNWIARKWSCCHAHSLFLTLSLTLSPALLGFLVLLKPSQQAIEKYCVLVKGKWNTIFDGITCWCCRLLQLAHGSDGSGQVGAGGADGNVWCHRCQAQTYQ